jgi:hypothetical protein
MKLNVCNVKIDAGKFLRFDYCFNLNIAKLPSKGFFEN